MSWKITSTFSIFLDIFIHIFYSVLTDQQSQVQASIKVYHKLTIIKLFIIIKQLQIAANLIHVMCVLLGIFGFLFLYNLNGKCVPFYHLSHLSKVAK